MFYLSANTLKAFSKVIMQVGEQEEYFDHNNVPVRRYESSDLEVIFAKPNGKWKFIGLSFWLFGANFIVDETGAVFVVDEEEAVDSIDSVFTVSDHDMQLAVRSFIQWRINVANKLGF